jgi:hypothetical protein
VASEEASSAFARNNLHFKGEEKFNKYGPALDTALNAWMHGDRLDQHVQKWFDFQVPKPGVSRDFINNQIEEYEKKNRERASNLNEKTVRNLWWLGGNPILCSSGTGNQNQKEYRWLYLMEEQTAPAETFNTIKLKLLMALRPEAPEAERSASVEEIKKNATAVKHLKKLLGRGLVLLDF